MSLLKKIDNLCSLENMTETQKNGFTMGDVRPNNVKSAFSRGQPTKTIGGSPD